MRVEEIAQHVSRTLETSAADTSIAATLSGNPHVFASWGRALWGLREWEGHWDDRVSLQLLAWRIEDEDLVFSILTEVTRPMTKSELDREIAARFSVRVNIVRQVTPVRRDDPRIHWRPGTDLVELVAWRTSQVGCLERCSRYLAENPDVMARISVWFERRWGLPLRRFLLKRGLRCPPKEA